MPFTPAQPFPKARGHTLRSEDWNALVTEVQRLDTAKVNKAGDIMTAPLTINTALLAGDRHLSVLGSGTSYMILRATSGGQEILVGADNSGGIVSTMSNHDLQLRAGGNNTRLTIKASGRVGIGEAQPTNMLHISAPLGLRVGELYLGGAAGWSSFSYNAYHNEANSAWVFPNQTRTALTVEMDDANNLPRFEVFSTTPANRTGWVSRFLIEGHTGNVLLAQNGGSVGIGTAPSHQFHVRGPANIALFESTGSQAYVRIAASDGIDNRVEITNRGGGRLSLWTAAGGDAFNIVRTGLVGIGTTSPGDRLHVATSMTVGPFRSYGEATGRLTLSGSSAELAIVRRNLGSWPASPQAGDRFVWYNPDGGSIRLWTEALGDIMTITRDGDVQIRGRIGNLGHSFVPRTSGWGGGIHTFDLEAEGTAWSRNGYAQGPRDVAETYPSLATLEPGDVVCLDHDSDRIILSAAANQASVVGIVSQQPGLLMGARDEAVVGQMFPVALCGMVPCKVVDENGPIRRGDLLTASSTPGHAMKAQPLVVDGQEVHRPGTILGKALSGLDRGRGVVDVLVTLM